MPAPSHPSRSLFLNIPVLDVERSRAFWLALGFGIDERASRTGENALVVVGDGASVMLSGRESFERYSHLPVGDPSTHALALYTFTVGAKEEVDRLSAIALAEGAREADGAEDLGFMYTRSFFDLDGHGWQIMWVSPDADAAGSPDGTAAAS